ncbi:GTP-binding protein [Candidatus Thorarchaeota archaeon]|nr:MAG: GTP-binding protein [Candidatus Thorarchaeota archaeon]
MREIRPMSGSIRRQFKVCLIGDGYVGKTSIRRTYLKEGFKRSYIPTLGVDFAQKSLLFEGSPTNLVIWDIAGQVAFQNLRRRYYEGSSGLILVYAVDDRKSFDSASKWLVEAHGFMSKLPPLMIVANKIDLRSTLRQVDVVTTEEGKAFAESVAQKLGTQAVFIETSAKIDKNIDETFEALTRMMIEATHQSITSFPASHKIETSEQESAASVSSQPTSPTPQTSFTPEPVEGSDLRDIDPVTLLSSDSGYLEEEEIGQAMTELQSLRSELKAAEEELANTLAKLETDMLTLKNTVHVKRIMFEHLKQQLKTTREEWAAAYEEHQALEKRRKDEFARRNMQIASIRKKIDQIGARIRSRIGDLDMRKMSE